MMAIGTKPVPAPRAPTTALPPDVAVAGALVLPIERLRYMSPQEWEDFVYEWAHSLKAKYHRVEQCGSSGDMGRDVLGFESSTAEDPWDNYQCKHYSKRLVPTDVWLELGKLAHYTLMGEYSLPRRYTFVAPQGASTALSKLIRQPDQLRQALFGAWTTYCQKGITAKGDVLLEQPLRDHILKIDFSIFNVASPLTLIEEHAKTPWHAARFGGGLPLRGGVRPPPPAIAPHETVYVRALLDAYEQRLSAALPDIAHLSSQYLLEHFSRARREFYSAESLREFSRDNVPPGTFESLLDEIDSGIADVVHARHPDGYERVLAVVRQAKAVQLTANALLTRTTVADRGGMCHQLANDKRVRWRA